MLKKINIYSGKDVLYITDDEKEAEGNSVREEDLIRDYDAEEEELVQQSADEDIE